MGEAQFFREMKKYEHIIIYGAGMVGGLVYKRLSGDSLFSQIIGFAVSEKAKVQTYYGKPIYEIRELTEYRKSAVVIIATMPELQKEIAETLSEHRFQNIVFVDRDLYRNMEQQYISDFVVSHPIRQKSIDVLFMASDNNCSSGAFLCMADLCTELRNHGVSSLVVLPEYGNGEQVLSDRKVEYTYVASEHWTYFRKEQERKQRESSMSRNEDAIKKIEQLVETYHVKIIHNNTTYTYVGAVAAHRKSVPVVWHLRENIQVQGFEFVCKEYAVELINQSDRVLAVSEYIKLCMDKLDGNKVQVVYDGVDIKKYFINRQILINLPTMMVTMVGAVASHKGQRDLIEAMRILKRRGCADFFIRFIGKGRNEDVMELKSLAREYRLEGCVAFLGRQDNVREFYGQTDVVVVCSKGEPFGRVTVEAQLAGCLVIGADTGATPELIQDGKTGLLYCQGEYEDLADKIAYAARCPETSREIALAGQRHACAIYTKERNAMEIMDVYNEILCQREK